MFLKEVSTHSRFRVAAGAIVELARQIVGPRTLLVSHIDANNLTVLGVLNAGRLHLTEGVYALEETY